MDCRGDDTVDLCSEPECVNSTVTFGTADRKAHTPNHEMFKVYRIIFERDVGRVENAAKGAVKAARGTLSKLEEEKKPMPVCAHCKATISLPCWYCVECAGE